MDPLIFDSRPTLTKSLSMIDRQNFRYLKKRALSLLTINCKMESQKHATRFDVRYDIYSGLWGHKPMKELGFECDFVKLDCRVIPAREKADPLQPGQS